jgi:hypothetical protein
MTTTQHAPAAPKALAPLPKPTPGVLVHRVTLDLSADEYACLCAHAERLDSTPKIAAETIVTMHIYQCWYDEQEDARRASAVSRETPE